MNKNLFSSTQPTKCPDCWGQRFVICSKPVAHTAADVLSDFYKCEGCGATLRQAPGAHGLITTVVGRKPEKSVVRTHNVDGIVTQCLDCAGYDIGCAPVGRYPVTNPPSDVYECEGCGAVIRRAITYYGLTTVVVSRKSSGRLANAKKPFKGYNEKELREISVALELLIDFPETLAYVEELQRDVNAALDKKK